MATKRKAAAPQDQTEDLSDLMSEEEATALAGAPADGYDEQPPVAPEELEPVAPFGFDDDADEHDPFGFERPSTPDWAQPLGISDQSVSKAQEAARVMREANATLLVHRIEPQEYQGMRTGGFIKRFPTPFSIQDAQVWCSENRGGGRYRYWIMDGGNTIRGGGTFEVEGHPKSPDEIKQAEAKQVQVDQHAQLRSDRERELERQLGDERMDRMMQMMMQQRREDQVEMRRMMEKIADRPTPPSASESLAPILTALAPVLVKVMDRPQPPPPPDHFKEIAVLVERFQSESARGQREMLERLSRPEKSEQMLYKMLEAVMQKQLGVGGHDPMAAVNTAFDKVLPGVVGKILNMATDKALGQQDEEKELTPRYIAEKASGLIENAVEKITAARNPQPPQPVMMPGHPVAALPPGAIPGQPMPGQAPIQGWPFEAQAPPGAPSAPGPQPTPAPMPVPPGPPTVGHTGPHPDPYGQTAPPPPPSAAPPSENQHVHPEVFQKAIECLQAGHTGEDLAVWVDDHNDGNRLLSREAIEYLENTQPFYLTPFLIEAVPPELQPYFQDPRAKQIVSDFCDWFYNTEPDDDAEAPSPVLGLTPQEMAAVTPALPPADPIASPDATDPNVVPVTTTAPTEPEAPSA